MKRQARADGEPALGTAPNLGAARRSARVLVNLGFVLLLVFGLLAAAAMVLAASVAALRTGVLPRWLAWSGLPLAALLLLGPTYVPQLLVPIWAVAVGIVLARRPPPATSPRTQVA